MPTDNTRVLVEQRIARGWDDQRIAADVGLHVEEVAACRYALDELIREADDPLPCGTHAAYNRHRAAGEPTDPACDAGERAYQAARRAQPKGRNAGIDPDLVQAIHHLTTARLSASEIAVRLRISHRTVTRYRARTAA